METSPELGRMGDLITPDATARSEECEAMGNINDYNKSLAALESASHATEREKEPTCTHAEREMTPENGIADVQCIGVDASTDANVSGGFNAREKDGESNLTRLACEATLVDVAADVAHVEGNVSPPANVPGELSDIDVGSRKDPIQQTAEAQRDSEQYQAQANGTAKLVGQEPQQDNDISPKAKRLNAVGARNASLEATVDDLNSEKNKLLQHFSVLSSKSHINTASEDLEASISLSAEQADASLAAAKAVIKEHISLLHQYNEMRDIGLGLMGIIADQRGVRLRDVQEEFGVDAKD